MLVDTCLVFCRELGTYSGLHQHIQDNVSLLWFCAQPFCEVRGDKVMRVLSYSLA